MAATENTTTVLSSSKQQRRLKAIGVVVLILGLVAAGVVYWIGTHSGEPSQDDLLPGNARAASHQMQLLYGKMGLLTQKLSDNLKQPATQALLIAAFSIVVAAGCFYFARLLGNDNEAK